MRKAAFLLLTALLVGALAPAASAIPVCTDGYKGGPPQASCGLRIFPEAAVARGYVQFLPDPATGFREYQHGIEYMAKAYPRWISVFNLRKYYDDKDAVSVGLDDIRSYEKGDTGDGHDIWIVKLTDHKVPDKEKLSLFFSLSVHGNERGGLEGGLRAFEDLAMAAESGTGTIVDGYDNYKSTTGRKPEFHEYDVSEVLRNEVVYIACFNPDGWAAGDVYADSPGLFTRSNGLGTDLNRQMPTIGRIDPSRNPLTESEMVYGHRFMHEVAESSPGNLMAHGVDIHGELNSNAYVDIMYPAGQFDSVDHRRLMAIAERTKSVIDETLYQGIMDEAEAADGGNSGEGSGGGAIPTKPAHWATVWDTLGYTDTGFIGDYLATDLAVTGLDYEFMLNHTVPDKTWNVYMQENHINGARAIIKTAMAYAFFQKREFNSGNVKVRTRGRAGYVYNPKKVRHDDANGVGTKPGAAANGIGADGRRVEQRPYSVSNMKWFSDTRNLMPRPFVKIGSGDVARASRAFRRLHTLVLADEARPVDIRGRQVPANRYYANMKKWVKAGGNLVLTDRAVYSLAEMGIVPKDAVDLVTVYQPYADIVDFDHKMVRRLRPNARQLVETAPLGYCIGTACSPMAVVQEAAFTDAGGHIVGTTGTLGVSVGQIPLGKGIIRIIGGALPTPTEKYDHRYGLRDYAMTYTGLYIMENSIKYRRPVRGPVRI